MNYYISSGCDLVLYSVHEAFTPWHITLLTTNKASVFFLYYICFCPLNQHHYDKPEINMSHSISDPPGFPQPTLSVHSKAKLKSNGDKASPCIRPFCMRQIFAYNVLLKYISINQTIFMETSDSVRILDQNIPSNRITCCLFVYK
jgi:hypothetical protein